MKELITSEILMELIVASQMILTGNLPSAHSRPERCRGFSLREIQ